MSFFIQIYDSNGNPEPVANFSDILVSAILAKGVGFFRTSNHVAEDVRAVINELFSTHKVTLDPPKVTHACDHCSEQVGVWHTFADGSVLCTPCKDLNNGD